MAEKDEQRTVRNRDIIDIQGVYYIMQDIVSLEERRIWQRERMGNITQHLTGMPGGGGTPKGLDDAFAAIAATEERHKLLCKRYARELERIERILNSIENEHMRTFVRLLYLDSLPGSEVRERLNMSKWGFDRARTAVEQANDMRSVVWHDRYIMA